MIRSKDLYAEIQQNNFIELKPKKLNSITFKLWKVKITITLLNHKKS
jgi:hypothetical protein